MPRPPRDNSSPRLSPGQASWVLDRLIAERRISAGEVSRYLSDMQREISDLEQRLQSLREAHGGGSSSSSSGGYGGGFGGAQQQRRGPGRPAGSGAGRPAGGGAGRPGRPGRPAGSGASAGSTSAAGAGRSARRPGRTPITAEQLASRQLQGRYLGLIRQIPANKRAQYQRTAKERGREAAIKEMQNVLGK